MKPNENNFCGGNFQDWLEVMLHDTCNGKCLWCVEKKGYKPKYKMPTEKLIEKIIATKKKNVILLGGEPTLHPDIGEIIDKLNRKNIKVYLTTNGSRLCPLFVICNLINLTGLNISIHDYALSSNYEITGIQIGANTLISSIKALNKKTTVRLNCNLIKEHVDSYSQVLKYITFAKVIGANGVRFAELKNDENNWVDMTSVFGEDYGVNNEPFGLGCVRDVIIEDMPVNLRQMCGLQTKMRNAPHNPKQVNKQVLYYDGKIYDGWQTKNNNRFANSEQNWLMNGSSVSSSSSGGCQY